MVHRKYKGYVEPLTVFRGPINKNNIPCCEYRKFMLWKR